MGRPKKAETLAKEAAKDLAPDKRMWKDKTVEKAISDLIEKVREGMPSVSTMQTQGFGVLRKHKEWEKKARPYINELEQILGRPVAVERFRPGR